MQEQHTTPQLTAIVCSRNNARSIGATLQSLACQKLPVQVGYEVIIVDNNSTDDTASVAQQFVSANPSVYRYVLERPLGLSFARNRGTAEARGEIVAFLDDDAIADPDWLARLWETYHREQNVVCVGGKIELQFPPGPLPSWYSEKLNGFLSARDQPYLQAKSARDFPYGTNISFRKAALGEVGGFHPLLGARQLGKIKLQGDETQLCLRLMKMGKSIVFEPAARVIHVVARGRLRKAYFLGLAQANGYVVVMLDNDGAIGVSRWEQLIRYIKRYLRKRREYRLNRSTPSEAEKFWQKVSLRIEWGSIWYCLWAKRDLKRLERELAQSS